MKKRKVKKMMDINEAISKIKANLKDRSGKKWRVRKIMSTHTQLICVKAMPCDCVDGIMSESQNEEITDLFGLNYIQNQGIMIFPKDREEYVLRSSGNVVDIQSN